MLASLHASASLDLEAGSLARGRERGRGREREEGGSMRWEEREEGGGGPSWQERQLEAAIIRDRKDDSRTAAEQSDDSRRCYSLFSSI